MIAGQVALAIMGLQKQVGYSEVVSIPWYHNEPIFMIEWPKTDTTLRELKRCVQIYIDPIDQDQAQIRVFTHAHLDSRPLNPDLRRLRSFYVFQGILPKDVSKIDRWLKTAIGLVLNLAEDDLLGNNEWLERQAKLSPIYATT